MLTRIPILLPLIPIRLPLVPMRLLPLVPIPPPIIPHPVRLRARRRLARPIPIVHLLLISWQAAAEVQTGREAVPHVRE